MLHTRTDTCNQADAFRLTWLTTLPAACEVANIVGFANRSISWSGQNPDREIDGVHGPQHCVHVLCSCVEASSVGRHHPHTMRLRF